VENDGPSKNGGWNLQDWKMTDEVAWVEFAGLENDELENEGSPSTNHSSSQKTRLK